MRFAAGVVAQPDTGTIGAGGVSTPPSSGTSRGSGAVGVADSVHVPDVFADQLGGHVVSVAASPVLRENNTC